MKRFVLVLSVFVGLLLLGGACGNQEAENAPAVEKPVETVEGTAENLGLKIASSYIETLKQIVAILNDKPAPADAMAMLSDMKSWTVDLMVGLGREREALPPEERAVVDLLLNEKIAMVPADLLKAFQDGQAGYKEDNELFNLIEEFNSITRYANFDLLKSQCPEEAKRLEIE